jgi:hypothetical protein
VYNFNTLSQFEEVVRVLKRFRNWCRPKRNSLSWFSLKENHSSRTFWDHSNCETALEQRRLRYVVWHTHFQAKEVAALFPASARMAPGALTVEPYLESRYKVV